MTDLQYVTRCCEIKNLSLTKPKKGSPDILVHNWNNKNLNGIFPCIVDAKTWADAKAQINAFYLEQTK